MEWNLCRPADFSIYSLVGAYLDCRVDLPKSCGVNIDRDRLAHHGLLDQEIQDLLERDCLPRTYVVGLSPAALFEEEDVCLGDVADVAEISPDFEVSDLEDWRAVASLDSCNLARPVRADEIRRLARARMWEWPCDDDIEILDFSVKAAQHFSDDLGICVRARDFERRFLR